MALLVTVVSILCVSFVSGASSDAPESVTVAADYPWWRQTTVYNDVRVRLVNGGYHSGRVEVYYDGQWGTICDDGFDHNAAKVICRMLGYYRGSSYVSVRYNWYYGEGDGPIMIDDIHCYGNENNIRDCSSSKWFTSNCIHAEDVGVDCYSYNGYSTEEPILYTPGMKDYTVDYSNVNDTETEGQVRLVDGTSYYNGRVEVYSQGRWGTICSFNFDHNDVNVICRMLGLYQGSSYGRAYTNGYFGVGNGPVIVSYLDCYGYEKNISECPSAEWLNGYCNYMQRGAGVDCYEIDRTTAFPSTSRTPYKTTFPMKATTTGGYEGQVRLVNGGSYYGRVEVYSQGRWGTICDHSFDHDDVKVICRMIGYYRGPSYGQAYGSAFYGSGSGPIIIDDLRCAGHETDIRNCASSSWYTNNCGHGEDAGVNCYEYYGESTTPYYPWWVRETTDLPATAGYEGQVRLVDGNYYNGRVEVYSRGQWGTICDDNFDHNDVKAVCRMLGLYQGNSYGTFYTIGNGNGPIIIDGLECNGYESEIKHCSSNPWFSHDCSHSEDVGINCYAYRMDMTTGSWWWQNPTTVPGYRVQDAVTVSCNENGWDIQVDMNTLRLINPMARASDIYLGENSCTGIESWHTLTFTQGLRECLTSEMIRNNELVYRNELVYAERDPQHPYIIRHYNWTVGIECDVMRNESASGHLHHDSNHNQLPQVSGTSRYTENMTFYSDPNFQNELPYPLPVSVGQNVYTKIYTTTSDWTIRLRVHTCYTKPSQYAADHLKYYIIKNGCEVDSNTHIISQSSHETRIVFQDFEYTNNKEGLYVFCDATFCSSQDYSRQCQQTCVPVVKRNIHVKTEAVTEDPLFDSETTEMNGSG